MPAEKTAALLTFDLGILNTAYKVWSQNSFKKQIFHMMHL